NAAAKPRRFARSPFGRHSGPVRAAVVMLPVTGPVLDVLAVARGVVGPRPGAQVVHQLLARIQNPAPRADAGFDAAAEPLVAELVRLKRKQPGGLGLAER